jgi:cytochrome c oxidase subunit 2
MSIRAVAPLLQVQVSHLKEHRITDIFRPMASPAEAERNIAMLTIGITAIIFVVVASLIVFTVWKYRRHKGDNSAEEPPQVYGSAQIEVAWTVIPILIVFILIGVSARVIAAVQNASPPKRALHVTLIGHQWWWQVVYPDYNFTTANEIHVPASADGQYATYLKLESIDVIHSFWVPQLAGKMDLIPNRDNYTWMDPKTPGVYVGNCAEYCGTQHANMTLRVVAQTPQEFQTWAAAQQKNASDVSTAAEGRKTFESLSCVSCHVIRGTSAHGEFGPDLTHLMSRQTLGSGVLENSPANLRTWVNDPQDPKPGCFMPSFKLTKTELDQVVSYLQTLQ